MVLSFLRAAWRRLPPVARRDQRIDALVRQVAERDKREEARIDRFREEFVRRPSFQSRIHAERRLRKLAAEIGAPSTSVIRHGKLHVYDLVRSHGIDPPAEYGRWDDPAVISWRDLPDLVVVKSAFSSASHGVFPLRRVGAGWQMITHTETLSSEQLVAMLTDLVASGKARPPFVAEEFLDEDGTGSRLPTDVKVYAFYGEVPMVTLRRPGRHGEEHAETPFRIIHPHGDDMEDFQTPSKVDRSMPIPANLDAVVDAASRLSIAIRAPFSRIDFYCIDDRIVFGEVTPRPGGTAWHGAAVDRRLGAAWDRAQVRLARDIADGMSPEPEFGPFAAARSGH